MTAPIDLPVVPQAVEQVVLLDESGAVVGTADKATVHGPDTPLHLAFSCYVFDGDGGQLLITRRALDKTTWGGWWTNSCCGHPAPGESLDDAVRRRVGQELGLTLDRLTLLLPRFRYRAVVPDGPFAGTVENEMCPVFVATTSSAPHPDPAEVAETAWVDWETFRAEVGSGERTVSPWCVTQVAALPEDVAAAPAADSGDLPAGAIVIDTE